MTYTISVLQKRELLGHEFTIYGTSDEPLFLAKDVAELIEHTHVTNMLRSLDEEEKLNVQIVHAGQAREYVALTEDGLYEVLMRSNKPIAKEFKKGVKTILKEIRKTGGYIATTTEESEEDIMAKALAIAQRTLKRREERIAQLQAENTQSTLALQEKQQEIDRKNQVIGIQETRIQMQENEIKASAPKVEYYEEVLQSESSLTITQIAKSMGMEAHALNKKLKGLGIQYKQSGQWIVCAPYASWGLHTTRTQTYTGSDGRVYSRIYTCWTHKGMRFIHALRDTEWSVSKASRLINE